ncbi:hypothetical protein IE077_003772 [Cardiosporidium cionae]|uniref:Helicase C-terminal domain-containing protein n=1 Tax=Cardiosporidium cionae TaxID=476202 RepID=A0ABQ7J7H2_9APIC|nr:hypothetical protein IE077_003772 [Cardiosporidium cionae]|eukprot:KAF8819947.1 hypothetical protein IE077_003772 [Cardiosporidium cionae]
MCFTRKVAASYTEEIEKQILRVKRMKNWSAKSVEMLVEGLRRGIGIHHNGLNRRYRDAVEILFRLGYLRVVLATGTLSLGIHMPCRSVIFTGDFLELTPLMYRQMSGRSGRRSFDLVGHVLFWCIPFRKVRHLITSKLPVLCGNFPVSPTQTLRAFDVWNRLYVRTMIEGNGEDLAANRLYLREFSNRLLSLYNAPLFLVSDKDELPSEEALQMLYDRVIFQLRFNIDFLTRSNFLKSDGNATALTAFAVYLFEEEPENFIIANLLSTGVLHRYLEILPPPHRTQHLMFILSHIFARQTISRSLILLNELNNRERGYHSHSISSFSSNSTQCSPLLPSLPSSIVACLEAFNRTILRSEINCFRAYFDDLPFSSEDFKLPFSHTDFSSPSTTSFFQKESPFMQYYQSLVFPFFVRSPFAAISGLEDTNFSSSIDLCDSVRIQGYTGFDSLPEFSFSPLELQNEKSKGVVAVLTNSYALEIFLNGNIVNLPWTHGIDASSTYIAVDKFLTIIKKLQHVVELTSVKDESSVILDTLNALLMIFQERVESVKA